MDKGYCEKFIYDFVEKVTNHSSVKELEISKRKVEHYTTQTQKLKKKDIDRSDLIQCPLCKIYTVSNTFIRCSFCITPKILLGCNKSWCEKPRSCELCLKYICNACDIYCYICREKFCLHCAPRCIGCNKSTCQNTSCSLDYVQFKIQSNTSSIRYCMNCIDTIEQSNQHIKRVKLNIEKDLNNGPKYLPIND